MASLHSMTNIGKVLEKELIEIGIHSSEELIAVGSRAAFDQIKLKASTACLSKLCALEGAVRGIRWHDLDEDLKKDLKAYHNAYHKF